MANQEVFNIENVILCAIIKIDNSDTSSAPQSVISSAPTNTENDKSKLKNQNAFVKLPRPMDPNLGLTGYLYPLNLPYVAKMNRPWNIAPYFLETLTQSPCCELSDCILLFGGLNPTNPDDLVLGSSVFEYHVSYKKWRFYGCMLEPRCYHQTSKTDSFVYVTGGYSSLLRSNGEMVAIPKTHRLDIKTTLWTECADMNTSRACHAMVAMKENLYVFGGRDCNGNILTSVEMYDTNNNEWHVISHMPAPLMGLSATVASNRIWLVGGITVPNNDYDHPSVAASVYSFSPLDRSWCSHNHLPSPHAFSSCLSNNRTIWVVGGSHFSQHLTNKSLVSCPCIWELSLQPRTQWNRISHLPTPTHASATALCGDSIVSIGGIHSLSENATNIVQVFNLLTKDIKPTGVSLPAKIVGASVVYFPRKASDSKRLNSKDASASKDMTKNPVLMKTPSSSQKPAAPDSGHSLKISDTSLKSTKDNVIKPQSMKKDSDFESYSYSSSAHQSTTNQQDLDTSSLQNSSTLSEVHSIQKGFIQDVKSSSDVPETFIYVKEIPITKQYVTSIEIPLNGAKLLQSYDTADESQDIEDIETSVGRIFKLYSPPQKWKERTKNKGELDEMSAFQ